MPTQHGQPKYFLVGDELYFEGSSLGGSQLFVDSGSLKTWFRSIFPSDLPAGTVERLFRYGRMFRDPYLPQYRPHPKSLIALGLAMKETEDPGFNPSLPAGYTFLGQFIDHDLSFDVRNKLSLGETLPEQEQTKCSPSLDLDSLYGFEPELVKQSELGRWMYEPDGIRLSVGETVQDPFVEPKVTATFPNDLPRGGDPANPPAAMIIDPRNDENLATAQTHLAFIKFHNAVVQHLSGTVWHSDLFEAARKKVVQHYQWLILNDYLPRIVEPEVLEDVIDNGCKHFTFETGEDPYMPVEFSAAAFRLGHSFVTTKYEWNRYFQSQPFLTGVATLGQLFLFTGFGGNNFFTFGRLPSSWIIDWTRFYDFQNFAPIENHVLSNNARRIGPSLVPPLMDLAMPGEQPEMQALSVRNLLRGRLLGLPTGQCVAARLGIQPLTPLQIANGPHRQILKESSFDQLTPLWYYILKESEHYHRGVRLGPIGSRIVAETFVRLIKSSRVSILPKSPGRPTWRPDLGKERNQFSVPDLLLFVHQSNKAEHFLNPLGA